MNTDAGPPMMDDGPPGENPKPPPALVAFFILMLGMALMFQED